MAHSIARALEAAPGRQIVHVCGSFHCERKLGIAEMVGHYRPGTKPLVVVICPEDDCHSFVADRHTGLGDYVLLTDASVNRSHDYMMPALRGESESVRGDSRPASAR